MECYIVSFLIEKIFINKLQIDKIIYFITIIFPMFIKFLKRIPFRAWYILREFIRKNYSMKTTYKYPQYSPHVGGKGKKFDKATEYNIMNLPLLLSDISTMVSEVKIINSKNLNYEKDLEYKIIQSFNKYGSDKVRQGKYQKVYAHIFKEIVSDPKNILEIGIGSKNKRYLSYMGKNETSGGSIRAFKSLYPEANIVAADIDIELQNKLSEESIELFYVDQTNEDTVVDLFDKFNHSFDLIIDDGLHLESSNLLILKHGLKKLSPKGCMIIEDIGHSALKTWLIVSNLLQTKYSSLIVDREGTGYCFIIYKN